MIEKLREYLLSRRSADGYFEGRLSDSAVSTAVACAALETADAHKYANEINRAKHWLISNRNDDGLYGDSPESPSNLTASFLAYAALNRNDEYQHELKDLRLWLLNYFGDFSFASVKRGFLKEYGQDLTFSVPILAMATAAKFFENENEAWRKMPKFPFEAVVIPENFFKYMNLPVVSYAIPALICVGLAQLHHTKNGIVKKIRSLAKEKSLRVLTEKQPESGGFLEAAPLTGFCAMCLCKAGLKEHGATVNSLRFLLETQRDNGAWPIDRDLRQWTTSLSLSALASYLSDDEKNFYRNKLIEHQTKEIHPFTRSAPGGWGWTTHSGSVPDADDTCAALIALHKLGESSSKAVENGIVWLLDLQNRDGGIPTFCRGWGRLPFDKSCPDLSAHAFRAFSCYEDKLSPKLRSRVTNAKKKIINYLKNIQRQDGAFTALWFGDQRSVTKEAPVYGSAVVLEHLSGHLSGPNKAFLDKTREYLMSKQHSSGGWGGADTPDNDVTVTARVITALKPYPQAQSAVERGLTYLRPFIENPDIIPLEPIGLYFAHLWYSEELYAPIFLLNAFSGLDNQTIPAAPTKRCALC
ncbi:MAG: squalene--hopene cyclase [Chitinispirillia bacterium]|nr:squalene--hopene cyclase [Chitinispirillia bacterium]